MSLVTGYESDSDDEVAAPQAKVTKREPPLIRDQSSKEVASSGLSSLLPVPQHSELSKPGAPKRKHEKLQIRVESIDSGEIGEEKGEGRLKRPKMGANKATGGGHGLFSMLPAPTNKVPIKNATRTESEVSKVNTLGMAEDGPVGALTIREEHRKDGETLTTTTTKNKGNDDFRAMLGLGPSSKQPKKVSVIHSPAQVASCIDPESSSASEPPASLPLPVNAEQPDETAQNDFFALAERANGNDAHYTESQDALSHRISLAPSIADEIEADSARDTPVQDAYRGWQQGADGTWFPATPEAHAQYAAFLSAQESERGLRLAEAEAIGGRIDPSQIHDFDANAQPRLDDRHAGPRGSTAMTTATQGSASSNQKYALAAASVADSSRARIDFDDDEEGDDEDRRKGQDRSTNSRARRKGQLSSLIAQADENREKLEERWSRGRAARNEAQRRYGF